MTRAYLEGAWGLKLYSAAWGQWCWWPLRRHEISAEDHPVRASRTSGAFIAAFFICICYNLKESFGKWQWCQCHYSGFCLGNDCVLFCLLGYDYFVFKLALLAILLVYDLCVI
jgi:hypothetical protein